MASHAGDLNYRIGVNVGDVVFEDGDEFGDGVNIAARLETVADPGGIAISGATHEYTAGRIDAEFTDGGIRELKNIDRAVQVWLWSPNTTREAENIPPTLPDLPSIVLLPFDNMSGDPGQEYIADGVAEALTAALSRIRAFFVIARNSAFAYKGRATNVQEIGRDLGVAYVLEGSVQQAGERLRITVQLVETSAGAHIWAEKYDGSLEDIFDLQDRITEQVAGALQPSIRLAEIERIRRKPPQDMSAYDHTMRAFRHVWALEKEEAEKALELLGEALRVDPEYPLALALAGWCHAQRSVYTWADDTDEARASALAFAERAANLSADDPLVLTVLGTVHTFARNFGAARVLLERAVALDPNAAWAWSRLGWLAVYADRADEALAHFEKALRLSPVDPMNFNNYVGMGSACQVAEDDATAAQHFERALAERPNAHGIGRNLAPSLYGAGRTDEAKRVFADVMATYPNLTVRQFKDAMVFTPRTLDRMGEQLRALGMPAG
jgi:adenylate cyclase